jgi:hypothetical protein
MFYSYQTNGFYDPAFSSKIPNDAVEISQEYYRELLEGQSNGSCIDLDGNGYPILVELFRSEKEMHLQQEISRRAAYEQEADPLFFEWQAGEATQEEWQSKRNEIKQRFPKD